MGRKNYPFDKIKKIIYNYLIKRENIKNETMQTLRPKHDKWVLNI